MTSTSLPELVRTAAVLVENGVHPSRSMASYSGALWTPTTGASGLSEYENVVRCGVSVPRLPSQTETTTATAIAAASEYRTIAFLFMRAA